MVNTNAVTTITGMATNFTTLMVAMTVGPIDLGGFATAKVTSLPTTPNADLGILPKSLDVTAQLSQPAE